MAMQVVVTGRGVEITDDIRSEIHRRLRPAARRLARSPADLTQCHVVLERIERPDVWQVRVTLSVGSPVRTLTSTEQADTLTQALVAAADDIVEQIAAFRGRVQRREHTYDDVRESKTTGEPPGGV